MVSSKVSSRSREKVLGGLRIGRIFFTEIGGNLGYLFGLKSNLAHALMVAALTLLICAILFTIGEFNNPFSGPVEIQPEAFREVLRSFGGT
jgi:hypothetical protein